MGVAGVEQLARGALKADGAAVVAAFGAEVDDPVGLGDEGEIVFDDDDDGGGAVVDEIVEEVEQPARVAGVQAGGRFVEDEDATAGVQLARPAA